MNRLEFEYKLIDYIPVLIQIFQKYKMAHIQCVDNDEVRFFVYCEGENLIKFLIKDKINNKEKFMLLGSPSKHYSSGSHPFLHGSGAILYKPGESIMWGGDEITIPTVDQMQNIEETYFQLSTLHNDICAHGLMLLGKMFHDEVLEQLFVSYEYNDADFEYIIQELDMTIGKYYGT